MKICNTHKEAESHIDTLIKEGVGVREDFFIRKIILAFGKGIRYTIEERK